MTQYHSYSGIRCQNAHVYFARHASRRFVLVETDWNVDSDLLDPTTRILHSEVWADHSYLTLYPSPQ